jgi:hypothetical protein
MPGDLNVNFLSAKYIAATQMMINYCPIACNEGICGIGGETPYFLDLVTRWSCQLPALVAFISGKIAIPVE